MLLDITPFRLIISLKTQKLVSVILLTKHIFTALLHLHPVVRIFIPGHTTARVHTKRYGYSYPYPHTQTFTQERCQKPNCPTTLLKVNNRQYLQKNKSIKSPQMSCMCLFSQLAEK